MPESSPHTPTPRYVADEVADYLRLSPERRSFYDWVASETHELQERVAQLLKWHGPATDAALACIREHRGWLLAEEAPAGA